jgi:TonB dependent receptor-like, beta-barrel/TonB-dependent Receptor Plug Domain
LRASSVETSDAVATARGAVVDMAVIDSELLARIPVGRRFSETLYMAPGVSSGGQVGDANPSVSGGSGLDNLYVVDGVNITNAGYGGLGSYSIVFGSLGNGVPFDFIQQAQVKTGGYEAEFGQASGGVINVITRSGTNALRGSGFGYFRPEGLERDYDQITTVNGTVNVTATRSTDVGAQVGGPVVRDHLFVFGAVDPQWLRKTYIAPEGVSAAQCWRGEPGSANHCLRREGHMAGGKESSNRCIVLWRSGHRQERPATLSSAAQDRHIRLQQARQVRRPQPDGQVRGTGRSALATRGVDRSREEHHRRNTFRQPPISHRQHGEPAGAKRRYRLYEVGNDGVTWQYQAKATNFVRTHTIRYGVEYDHVDYANTINRTGPTFTLPDGTPTVTGAQIEIDPDPTFGQVFRVTRANTTNLRDTTQHYVNAFVQDSWVLWQRLTVNPGIRYERQRLMGTLETLTLSNNWAPRIGATYDPSGKGTMKIYGNWGIYYSKVPNDLAPRALSSDAAVSRADYFDLGLTQAVPEGVLALGTTSHFLQQGVSADLIDPAVKSSYVNEAVAGFDYEVLPGMNLGVRYIHRHIPRVLEDVQPFAIVAGDLGLPGATTADYTLTNPAPSTSTAGDLGASFEKAIHRYNAIEVTADKRLFVQVFAPPWDLRRVLP